MLTINLETAEGLITSLFHQYHVNSNNASSQYHFAQQILWTLQQTIQQRHKEIQALQEITKRILVFFDQKFNSYEEIIISHQNTIRYIDQQMTTLDNDKSYYEKIISQVKRELCIQRQVAVDRRSKKSKRECQYNKISWVPCFSILYLRKYKKARDRLAMADQAVVDANNTLIAYRASLHEKINSMYCLQTEKENIEDKIKKTVEDVGSLKKLAAQLSESDDFWRDFYTYHIKFTSETVKDLIEIFRTGSSKNHEHSIKAFKISCLEYGEAEAYGNSRWSHLQVDYNCSDCGVNHTGWPILDIKTEHGLLCSVCGSHAQESRISVVSFSSKKSAQSTMNSKKNLYIK